MGRDHGFRFHASSFYPVDLGRPLPGVGGPPARACSTVERPQRAPDARGGRPGGPGLGPLHHGLGLDDQSNRSILVIEHVGLNDDGATPPMCRGFAVARTNPERTPRKKFVFDSIVDVVAPSGRFRYAQMAPTESARDMMAPPWRIPPLVHRPADQASVPVTALGSVPSSFTSIPWLKGMRPRSTVPWSGDGLDMVDMVVPPLPHR